MSCEVTPKVKMAIVTTPVNSPMPMMATASAASSSVGMVRTMLSTRRTTPVTTRLRVTTVVAKNARGTATTKPTTVPSTDILMVRTIGSISSGISGKSRAA